VDSLKLLEALDTFLGEATRAERLRIIADAERKIKKVMVKVFLKQGRIFAEKHARYKNSYPVEEAVGPGELDRMILAITSGTESELTNGITLILGETMDGASKGLMASMKAGDEFAKAAFSLKNPRAVKWLDSHAAELVKGVGDTTRSQMRTLLTKATDEGWSYNRTAKEIKEKFDGFAGKMPQQHIQSRAHLVATTESRFAYEQANLQTAKGLQAMGLEMEKSWLTRSGNVCEICAGNESDGWIPVDDAFSSGDDAPPAHPACLPDGVSVLAYDTLGAMKRRYDGDLIIIKTAGGNRLPCTPNHPILTSEGWIGAGEIDIGSYVISTRFSDLGEAFVNMHEQDRPTLIEDIVSAFAESSGVSPRIVEVTAPDFHGDGEGSDVAAIWANSFLGGSVEISGSKHTSKDDFIRPDIGMSKLTSASRSTEFLKTLLATTRSFMSCFRVALVFFWGTACHTQAVGCKDTPALDTSPKEAFFDGAAVNTVSIGESFLGDTRLIKGDKFIDRELDISPDMVIGLRRISFSGHVYNLQTKSGAYIANNIITHNCRCDMLTRRKGAGE